MDMASEKKESYLEKVTFRMACEADYEGVLAIIPNLYNGKDYMPVCFHSMIKDPRRYLVIAEVDGEIVALEVYCIMEDGHNIIGEGGRIKPKYQGKRLMRHLFQYASSSIWDKFPNATHFSFTTQDEKGALKMMYNPALESIFYRHLLRVALNKAELMKNTTISDICQEHPFYMTRQLLPSEAVETLQSLVGTTHILTEPSWILNYEPFKPQPCNHITMVRNNIRGIPVVMETVDSNKDITAISFGATTVIKEGIMLTIDFYCHRDIMCTNKVNNTINAHLMRHLMVLNQLKGPYKHVVIDVVLDKDMSTDLVLECLTKIGLFGAFKVVHNKKRVYCIGTDVRRWIKPKL